MCAQTFFRIAMERSCRNSLVLSGSCPATILDGFTLTISPWTKAEGREGGRERGREERGRRLFLNTDVITRQLDYWY